MVLRFMAAAHGDVALAPSIQIFSVGFPHFLFIAMIISHRDGILLPLRESEVSYPPSPALLQRHTVPYIKLGMDLNTQAKNIYRRQDPPLYDTMQLHFCPHPPK